MEYIRNGLDKRALKLAKRKVCDHKHSIITSLIIFIIQYTNSYSDIITTQEYYISHHFLTYDINNNDII